MPESMSRGGLARDAVHTKTYFGELEQDAMVVDIRDPIRLFFTAHAFFHFLSLVVTVAWNLLPPVGSR